MTTCVCSHTSSTQGGVGEGNHSCVRVESGTLRMARGVVHTGNWNCEGVCLEGPKARAELEGVAFHMSRATTGLDVMEGAQV